LGIAERKARDFKRREEEILKATLDLVTRMNWRDVTIDDIAERAEIGKGTFYKHFISKDEACMRIVMGHSAQLLEKLQGVESTGNYEQKVRNVLRVVWAHHKDCSELAPLQDYCNASPEKLQLSEETALAFSRTKEGINQFLFALVNEGIELGIIPGRPVEFPLYAGWALMEGAIRLIRETDLLSGISEEKFLDYLIDFMLKGFMHTHTLPDA